MTNATNPQQKFDFNQNLFAHITYHHNPKYLFTTANRLTFPQLNYSPFKAICSAKQMLFLTNELAKKAEITILSARKSTRPGLQAGASWVERKPFKRKGIVRDSHLGL